MSQQTVLPDLSPPPTTAVPTVLDLGVAEPMVDLREDYRWEGIDNLRSRYRTTGQFADLAGQEGYFRSVAEAIEAQAHQPPDQIEAASIWVDLSRLANVGPEQRTAYRQKARPLLEAVVAADQPSWQDKDKLLAAMLLHDLNFAQLFDDLWQDTIHVRDYKERFAHAMQSSIAHFNAAGQAYNRLPDTHPSRPGLRGPLLEWAFIIDRRTLAYLSHNFMNIQVGHSTLRQDIGHRQGKESVDAVKARNFDVIYQSYDDDGAPDGPPIYFQLKLNAKEQAKNEKKVPSAARITVVELMEEFRLWEIINAIAAEGRIIASDPQAARNTPLERAFRVTKVLSRA